MGSRPKVRLATAEDFERVCPLLRQLTSRLEAEDWKHLFENLWREREFRPGLLLESGDEVVGFIATIYKHRTEAGGGALTCNLSSWIVKDAFRSSSILLLLPLLRQKNVVYTSFSSNDVSYEVYRRLGFEDDERRAQVLYPFPSPRARDYRIETDRQRIEARLDAEHQRIDRDHSRLKARRVLIQRRTGESCWCLAGVRAGKMKLYYASDPQFVRRHVQDFRWQLMRRFRVTQLQIGGNIIGDSKPFLSRRKNYRHPHQVKGAGNQSVDRLYSELLLLDM